MDSSGRIIGVGNFSGGETIIERVTAESSAVLERCNGFKCEDGSITPDGLVDVLTATALTATIPEQVPAVFINDEESIVVARDKDSKLRLLTNDVWGSALDECDIVPESTPAKVGPQVVMATKGAHPELMLIEPGVTSGSQVRPLSIKSPRDYVDGASPSVTAVTADADPLFDCADTWVDKTGCTTTKPTATSALLSIASTAPADEVLTGIDLGGTGIDPTGKSFFVIDVQIETDPQNYSILGLFANDLAMQASGYEISLCSDQSFATEMVSLPIPRLTTNQVHRVAFNIGELASPIKSIAIRTASFFEAPDASTTYTVRLFSDATWSNAWTFKGNFLLPAVAFSKSPYADSLSKLTSQGALVDLPESANLVLNSSFEAGSGVGESGTSTSWDMPGTSSRWPSGRGGIASHTGGIFIELDNYGSAPESISQADIALSPGVQYFLECWYLYAKAPAGWRMTLAYKTSGGAAISTQTFPSSGYYSENISASWQLKRESFVPPATTHHATLTIETNSTGALSLNIDDVSITRANTMTQGNAVLLMTQSLEGTDLSPVPHYVEYCYVYAVRDKRSTDEWRWALSNPSKAQDTPTIADPWTAFTLSASKLGGRIASASVNAGGTGYAAGDLLVVSGVKDSLVEVSTVSSGVVTAVEVINAGTGLIDTSGYKTAVVTTQQTGSGNDDCALDLTCEDATDEYGDYLQYVLFYRRLFNGAVETWGDWTYVGAAAWSDSAAMSMTDAGLDVDPSVDLHDVPEILEINNAIASSARYVIGSKGRVYSACLDWDPEDEKWMRPTAIQVSSYDKPWAHPTLVTDYTLTTDGTELDGYAVSGSVVRGLAVLDEDVMVFLDNEFFHCRGEDPAAGWRFIARQSVACKSNRTIATSARSVFWHDGTHFMRYSGGVAAPVSRFLIDSTLIDWTEPHSAVYFKDSYIFHCVYDSEWALLIFDTRSESWRIRRSAELECVGICADTDHVYGITPSGHALSLFGSTTNDGTETEPVREMWMRYMRVSPPGYDAQVCQIVLDIVGTAGESVDLQVTGIGAKTVVQERELVLVANKTRYQVGINLKAEFVQFQLTYTGTTPPESIHFAGFDCDNPRAS